MADTTPHDFELGGYSETQKRYDKVVERVQAKRTWPPSPAARNPAMTGRPDIQLVDAIVQALEADPQLAPFGLVIDYHHGAIQLQGAVPDPALAARVEQVAHRIAGTTPIHNALIVPPAA